MLVGTRTVWTRLVGILAVGALATVAAALDGIINPPGPGGGGQFSTMTIIAPDTVIAGSPITGIVTCFVPPVNVTCTDDSNSDLPGSPTGGFSDPVYFCFLTTEPMVGTCVTIVASDSYPSILTHTVFIQ